jgi:hypothetical protein
MNPCHTSPSVTKTDVYDVGRPLSLLTDRQRISINDRTDRVWSVTFNFDSNLLCALLDYASMMNTTLDYLAFTCYYVFLFKLTNGEKDLCVGRNIDVGYQSKLHDFIDKVVNT